MNTNESDDERSDREELEGTFGPLEHVHVLIGGIPYKGLALQRHDSEPPGVCGVFLREPVGKPEDIQRNPDMPFFNVGTLIECVWGDMERHPITGWRVLRHYHKRIGGGK
jgi:hypothetical protein